MTPIRHCLRAGMMLGLLSLAAACHAAKNPRTPMNNNEPMVTHHIGRFMIQVPQSMKVAYRSARLRHRELQDVKWPSHLAHEKSQDAAWQMRLNQVQQMPPPKGVQSALIEQREISRLQPSIHSLRYFNENDFEEINWDTLVDTGIAGLWIKSGGMVEYTEEILGHDIDIARAYHPLYPEAVLPKGNAFFLEHGFIALPYAAQEEAYARFEGHPLNVKFEITTTETHQVVQSGPLERLVAALAMNFAPGVDVDRIRGGKRIAAGFGGEEIVLRMTNDDKTSTLRFGWEYHGKANSGNEPEIHVEMEAEDGQLEEKLELWDALLNSFKPVGR